MSDGHDYGFSWQRPIGWLEGELPSEPAQQPLIEVAKKLAYYMSGAPDHLNVSDPSDVPTDQFYLMEGGRGPYMCRFLGCHCFMGGVFGFLDWVLPTGIVHYIVDHGFVPEEEFLRDLATLPDPPPVFSPKLWCVPSTSDFLR